MRRALVLALPLALAAAATPRVGAQQVPTARALAEPWPEIVKVDGIEILHVRKGIYMLVGGGANVTAQIGEEGVTLVDSGAPGQGEKIVAAVRHLTKKPLRYLVNTNADLDKTGGNAAVVKAAGGTNGRAGQRRRRSERRHPGHLARERAQPDDQRADPARRR